MENGFDLDGIQLGLQAYAITKQINNWKIR
jgi:hypothetical protein